MLKDYLSQFREEARKTLSQEGLVSNQFSWHWEIFGGPSLQQRLLNRWCRWRGHDAHHFEWWEGDKVVECSWECKRCGMEQDCRSIHTGITYNRPTWSSINMGDARVEQ